MADLLETHADKSAVVTDLVPCSTWIEAPVAKRR